MPRTRLSRDHSPLPGVRPHEADLPPRGQGLPADGRRRPGRQGSARVVRASARHAGIRAGILLLSLLPLGLAQSRLPIARAILWNDEFVGPAGSLPDPGRWTFDLGRGQNGWGNNELEEYTRLPENVS